MPWFKITEHDGKVGYEFWPKEDQPFVSVDAKSEKVDRPPKEALDKLVQAQRDLIFQATRQIEFLKGEQRRRPRKKVA